MESIAERMARAGITLPLQRQAQGNYVPFLIDGSQLWISGQVSSCAGKGIIGRVGDDVDVPTGIAAAKLSGLNLLAQIHAALDGDFERVRQVVRITGHVQVADGFVAIPQIMNGCSDVLVEALGDRGRHTRTSVGAYRLPGGHAVEVDAVIRIAA